MYCRDCGYEMNDNDMVCRQCGVKKGEGVDYCHACGYYTTIKTEYCSHCGAKQRTIVTQKMKNTKLQELNKQAKTAKKFMRLEKMFAIIFFTLAIVIFVYSVTRPAPEDYSVTIMQGTGTTWHNDPNVLFYWKESQEHLVYIIASLGSAFCSFVGYRVEKSKYKKILRAIKEAKNVL